MATLRFGNKIPVDMQNPNAYFSDFTGDISSGKLSRSKLTANLSSGATVILTGKFDKSSVANFKKNSTFKTAEFRDPDGDLHMKLTGLPNLTFKQISTLSGNKILSIITKVPLKMFGSIFGDVLIGSKAVDIIDGRDGDDIINSDKGNDTLIGGAGDDVLNGGSGNDRMEGGTGDDTYMVNSTKDKVIEKSGSGFDTVKSSINFTLPNHVENLELTGSKNINGKGNDLDNTITGNSRQNVLTGGDGDDKLDGAAGNDTLKGGAGEDILDGGSGVDKLNGGTGNDILILDQNDSLVDGGSGIDTLQFNSANETLNLSGLTGPAEKYRNIEIVNLTGTGDNTLNLNIQDVLDLPDVADAFISNGKMQLLIMGDANDAVNSTGQGWTVAGTEVVDSVTYNSYTHATIMAQLLVDQDITQNIS